MESGWTLGQVQPIKVLAIHKKVSWEDFQAFLSSSFIQLHEYAKSKGVTPAEKVLTLTHEADEDNHDVTVCLVLAAPIPAAPGIEYKELPGGPAYEKTFTGTYGPVIHAYAALAGWVKAAGKTLQPPIRTLYAVSLADGERDSAKWVTEVKAPVS